MRLTIGRRIGGLVLFLLLIMGLSGLVSYTSMAGVVEATKARKHSYQIMLQVEALLSQLANA